MAIQYSTTHRSNSMTQLNTDIGANAQIQIYSGSIPANVGTAPLFDQMQQDEEDIEMLLLAV